MLYRITHQPSRESLFQVIRDVEDSWREQPELELPWHFNVDEHVLPSARRGSDLRRAGLPAIELDVERREIRRRLPAKLEPEPQPEPMPPQPRLTAWRERQPAHMVDGWFFESSDDSWVASIRLQNGERYEIVPQSSAEACEEAVADVEEAWSRLPIHPGDSAEE
jgi:hypothetical protein